MSAIDLAQRLAAAIPAGRPGLFNPYRDRCPYQTPNNSPQARLDRLARHLDCARPRFILCGEAPGYQGCRYSGITFTSERLLGEGVIPRLAPSQERLSLRALPFSEPSATIVWKTLYRLNMAEDVILWNALQMHPHKPGNAWSNRTPTPTELAMGAPAMRLLADAFPGVPIIAVGRKAQALLSEMGIEVAGVARHPANGGANEFSENLQRLCLNATTTLRDTC